jgi:hypothetical protein
VKKAMMHAQSKSEKESEDKEEDDNASQTLRKLNKSDSKVGWNKLIVKNESLHNNGKQWASGTKGNSIFLDNGSMSSLFGNPDMVKIRTPERRQLSKLLTYLDSVRCKLL